MKQGNPLHSLHVQSPPILWCGTMDLKAALPLYEIQQHHWLACAPTQARRQWAAAEIRRMLGATTTATTAAEMVAAATVVAETVGAAMVVAAVAVAATVVVAATA